MATASTAVIPHSVSAHLLSVSRLLVTGAVTAAVILLLCWVSAFLPFSSPTHAYIALFTPAEISSVQALVEGTGWSLLFGGVVGGVFAIVYNAAAPRASR